MSSIIEGYSYDIFISYRQKDNKHDGWVTGFVNNLKGELESIFKEDISVYFDENPHDGLLDTHNVDKSIETKLKCLVFIPVISQTYCDPKSYAWQKEFCAFNKTAKEDSFGRDIKLSSGNVASRILPVKIHDLDTEDKTFLETELGGVLRSIEFIYKSPGVNRPLRANEDHPQDNLNKTYYRDQINKVANAVKEIIGAFKIHSQNQEEVPRHKNKIKFDDNKNRKLLIIAGALTILALAVFGYIFIPKLFRPVEQIEKSIAVLPFINDSPDQENGYFINGIMDEILNNLQKIKEFKVLSRTSTEQYRGTLRPPIPKIAKALGVNYIIEGSGQKYGNKFVLRVQLIAAGNERHIWGKSYNLEIKQTSDIINIQSEIAVMVAGELETTITPEEKQSIEKTPTTNLSAYDFYQQGAEEMKKYAADNSNKRALIKAEGLFKQSLKCDSAFAQAYTGLSRVYWIKHYAKSYLSRNFLDSVLILVNRAISYNDQLAEAYWIKANYYNENGEIELAIKENNKAIKYNPNCWEAYLGNAHLYIDYDLVDYVKVLENYQKVLSINHGTNTPGILREVGNLYSVYVGFKEKANYYFQEALKLDGDSLQNLNCLANEELWSGNYIKAIELFNKSYARNSGQIGNLGAIGLCYLFLRQDKEVLKYYKQFADRTEAQGDLNLYGNHRLGFGYWKNGYTKEAEHCFIEQKKYCEESIKLKRFYSYTGSANYDLACIYSFEGEKEKAYENLKLFNKPQICSRLWVTNIKADPMFDSIRNEPEFQQIVKSIESKYQAENERVRKWLKENKML
jgi:TolB-like protein/Tfp pilus assembly protein PilF